MNTMKFMANDIDHEIESTESGLVVRSETYTVEFDSWNQINASFTCMKDNDRDYTVVYIQSFEAPVSIALEMDDEEQAMKLVEFITP